MLRHRKIIFCGRLRPTRVFSDQLAQAGRADGAEHQRHDTDHKPGPLYDRIQKLAEHCEADQECRHNDGQADQRGADGGFVAVSRLANQAREKCRAKKPIGLKNKHNTENQQQDS